MGWLNVVWLGILGLAIGSFLGAFTWRLPRRISISKGRSFCPNCKEKISWYDNVPVVSYLLLDGKCRNCKQHISLRYPLIELLTAIIFVLIGLFIQSFWLISVYVLVSSILVSIFVVDLEHQVIPDSLIFFVLILTSAYYLLVPSAYFFTNLAVGFISALFLLGIHLITRGRGMGLGDVKFALFGGTFVGWPLVLPWFFASFLTGAAVGLILILLGRARLKQKIAFGPFLIIGLIISYLWGEKILRLTFGI